MRTAAFVSTILAVAGATAVPAQPSHATRVVLLGTGAPPADPVRSGPATAIVVSPRHRSSPRLPRRRSPDC
jgi:hypothetical protein